jgi:glyceraldehyde-3-phosphate dehydrogenase/erythrose-4-phosphate dehydrogenase
VNRATAVAATIVLVASVAAAAVALAQATVPGKNGKIESISLSVPVDFNMQAL